MSSDPLRAFLTGKRAAKRHPVAVPVQIQGPNVWLTGESIDASATGLCMRVAFGDLLDGGQLAPDVASFDLVRAALNDGVKLLFPVTGIMAEATPVRIALDPEREGWLHLGCRFATCLNEAELRRMGIDPSDSGPENPMYGPPSQALPVQIEAGEDMRVSLFRLDDTDHRLFEGRVIAVGPQALVVALTDETDPHDVLRRIGCLELSFRAIRQGEVVWDSRALIAALPVISSLTGAIEVGLVATSPPTGSLLESDPMHAVAISTSTNLGTVPAKSGSKPRKKAARKRKKAARKSAAKKKAAKKRTARKRPAKKKAAKKQAAKKSASTKAPATQAPLAEERRPAAGRPQDNGAPRKPDPTPVPVTWKG